MLDTQALKYHLNPLSKTPLHRHRPWSTEQQCKSQSMWRAPGVLFYCSCRSQQHFHLSAFPMLLAVDQSSHNAADTSKGYLSLCTSPLHGLVCYSYWQSLASGCFLGCVNPSRGYTFYMAQFRESSCTATRTFVPSFSQGCKGRGRGLQMLEGIQLHRWFPPSLAW